MSRVLVIPDLHAPAIHPAAFDFVRSLQDEWQTDRTVFIGDAFDLHSVSYHAKEMGLPNALQEVVEAKDQMQPFYDHFSSGKVDYMVGNHCALIMRKAVDACIPEEWIRPIKEIFGMPKNWKIHERYARCQVDGVQYLHGDSSPGGNTPALAHAVKSFQSTVIGHFHASFGVNWYANDNMRIFGCNVGSLCDSSHLAQKYGRKYTKKPILGAAVVIDGSPYCEPLLLPNRGVR
jgi:hypothetical protein